MFDALRRALGIEPHQSIARAYLQTPQPQVRLQALCTTHQVQHQYRCAPHDMAMCQAQWRAKHDPRQGCSPLFYVRKVSLPARLFTKGLELFGQPWWAEYDHNADVKMAYVSSAAFTCGLHATPLASSSTFVLGRESTAVSNAGANLFLNATAGGKVTTGTSPTAGVIRLYLYASVDDGPTYPDVLDGTDSDETFNSPDIQQASTVFFQETATDSTSNRTYWFRPLHIALYFAGAVPANWGLFVSHNTVAALNSTSTNHVLSYKQHYATVV